MFPDWLRTLAYLTPFPSILQSPIDVLSGHVTGTEAFLTVGMQLFWLAVTCLIGRVLLNAGRQKLVVQGG